VLRVRKPKFTYFTLLTVAEIDRVIAAENQRVQKFQAGFYGAVRRDEIIFHDTKAGVNRFIPVFQGRLAPHDNGTLIIGSIGLLRAVVAFFWLFRMIALGMALMLVNVGGSSGSSFFSFLCIFPLGLGVLSLVAEHKRKQWGESERKAILAFLEQQLEARRIP
jgi:hypothetical protein